MSIKRFSKGESVIGICPEHHEKIKHVETNNEETGEDGYWVHEFFCSKCNVFYE
jgi:hypothetical protein